MVGDMITNAEVKVTRSCRAKVEQWLCWAARVLPYSTYTSTGLMSSWLQSISCIPQHHRKACQCHQLLPALKMPEVNQPNQKLPKPIFHLGSPQRSLWPPISNRWPPQLLLRNTCCAKFHLVTCPAEAQASTESKLSLS